VAISGSETEEEKNSNWQRLLSEKKLGGMAFFRNLRNMLQAGVKEKDLLDYMYALKTDRLLPMNLYAAGRIMGDHSAKLQAAIEEKMVDMLKHMPQLDGKTAIVIDTSGSMFGSMVARSKFERVDYALALATIIQGICKLKAFRAVLTTRLA
jgi:uncharacterized protein with von Willebrand factor type A (vWA) domain